MFGQASSCLRLTLTEFKPQIGPVETDMYVKADVKLISFKHSYMDNLFNIDHSNKIRVTIICCNSYYLRRSPAMVGKF